MGNIYYSGNWNNCYCVYENGQKYDRYGHSELRIYPEFGYRFVAGDFPTHLHYPNEVTAEWSIHTSDGIEDYLIIRTAQHAPLQQYDTYLNPSDYNPTPKNGALVTYDDDDGHEPLTNYTCNYSNGEPFKVNKRIEIIPNEGYTFIGGVYPNTITLQDTVSGTIYHVTTSLSGDKLVLSGTIQQLFEYGFILYAWEFEPVKKSGGGTEPDPEITPGDGVSGFINIYFPTDEQLDELSSYRFIDGMGYPLRMGDFISVLYKLPVLFEVDTVTESIILGGESLPQLKFDKSLIDTVIIDFGKIVVSNKYENVYDFMNTNCILHVPFFEKIYLETEYVIGQEIYLKCIIDLYSGGAVLKVKSSFTNNIVYTQNSSLNKNIPFFQQNNGSIINMVSGFYRHGSGKPFIEVIRNIPYSVNSDFGKEVLKWSLLGDLSGFVKCSDLKLVSGATNSEKEEIKNLLKAGIFV